MPVSQEQFDADLTAFGQTLTNGLASIQSNYQALQAKLAAAAPTVDLSAEDAAIQADLTALNAAVASLNSAAPAPAQGDAPAGGPA